MRKIYVIPASDLTIEKLKQVYDEIKQKEVTRGKAVPDVPRDKASD